MIPFRRMVYFWSEHIFWKCDQPVIPPPQKKKKKQTNKEWLVSGTWKDSDMHQKSFQKKIVKNNNCMAQTTATGGFPYLSLSFFVSRTLSGSLPRCYHCFVWPGHTHIKISWKFTHYFWTKIEQKARVIENRTFEKKIFFCIQNVVWIFPKISYNHFFFFHGGRVVTLSPPTFEVGVQFPAWPQVGKLVVACRWSAVYSTEPWRTVCTGFLCPSNYLSWYDLYSVESDVKPQINESSFSRHYAYKQLDKDPFITFGVIGNTDKQGETQTDKWTHPHEKPPGGGYKQYIGQKKFVLGWDCQCMQIIPGY